MRIVSYVFKRFSDIYIYRFTIMFLRYGLDRRNIFIGLVPVSTGAMQSVKLSAG